MKIAVCDDEEYFRNHVKNSLLKVATKDKIECFSDGCYLLEAMKSEKFDVVYLDIDMPKTDGMATSEKLKQLNQGIIIIFVSSYSSYIPQAFRMEAFQFLVKPATENDVIFEYERSKKKYLLNHFMYSVSYKLDSRSYEINEIVYIESHNRHLYVHDIYNKVFEYRGKMDSEEKKLTPYNFVRIHESYLVNMTYLQTIRNESIVLSADGYGELPASRKYKADVSKKYNLFLTGCTI